MYGFKSRVRYSELGPDGKLTLASILDYFQDACFFQSEELGIGVDYLIRQGVCWILISWQLEVERYPRFGEEVIISTWPYGFKGFYGYRNFQMMDKDGNPLARANSIWVLMNPKMGRPTKILPRMQEAYKLSPALPMQSKSRKIALPAGSGEFEQQEAFPVKKYHLDTNHHVNNSRYISMAQEFVPDRPFIRSMQVEYKKSAIYGDVIYPKLSINPGIVIVVLENWEHQPYVIVEFESR